MLGRRILAVFLGSVWFVGASSAQVTTATLSGTVQDSTGAVLPRANLVIRNTDTGLTRTVVSDEAGGFE